MGHDNESSFLSNPKGGFEVTGKLTSQFRCFQNGGILSSKTTGRLQVEIFAVATLSSLSPAYYVCTINSTSFRLWSIV